MASFVHELTRISCLYNRERQFTEGDSDSMRRILSGLLFLLLSAPVLPAQRVHGRAPHGRPSTVQRPNVRTPKPPAIRRWERPHSPPTRQKPTPTRPWVVPAKKGSYTADLRLTRANSRSGHRAAANRQLAERMKGDRNFRRQIQRRFGKDAYARVKSGRNPRGAEWDHSRLHKYSLRLLSRAEHRKVTAASPGRAGGHAMYYNAASQHTLIGKAKSPFNRAAVRNH
jgi:hypothetical protein